MNNEINKISRQKNKEKAAKELKEKFDFKDSTINDLLNPSYGRPGVGSYVNQNISGRIKNYKDQIAKIKRSSQINESGQGAVKEGDNGKHNIGFTNNKDAERVQLDFSGKPNAETRQLLKRSGFRWSLSQGVWQRQNNENGHAAAKKVLAELDKKDNIY